MPKRKSSSSTKTESVDWDSRWKRAQEERITLDLFDQYFSQEEVRIRVIGTRQNEYSVVIKRGDRSTCTCYDNRTNGFFCKHLMLVLIRTFRVPEELVANCQDVTHDIYLDCAFAYQERKEKDDLLWKEEIKRLEEEVQKESKQPKKKPIDVDDDCAICCEKFVADYDKRTNYLVFHMR